MNSARDKYGAFVSALVLLVVGCTAKETTYPSTGDSVSVAESKPIIAATNFALQSMAQEIVGDVADVIRPQVQTDPMGGLKMEEVIRMQEAIVVLTNGPGADDAAWLNLISLNESRVHATTSDEFELNDFIQVEDYRTVHSHGDEGEHSHPWLVPHCWLSPRLAVAQSLSILNRLSEVFPKHETAFSANHRALQRALEPVKELANEVEQLLQAKRVTVIASDPRLLFFTRAVSCKDNYFLWFEPPEISTAIAELEKRKSRGAKKLLLLCPESAQHLAEELSNSTDVVTATIDLIEQVRNESQHTTEDIGGSGGFVSQLRANYQTLKTVVEGMSD